MLNTVLNCPKRGIGVFRAWLISGMSRPNANSCGPVEAVDSAKAKMIVFDFFISIKRILAV
jgi:hypothetical protein